MSREALAETAETYIVILPRKTCMAPVCRRWVRGLLDTHPRVDDVELVAGQLAGNTIRYGQWDAFAVTLTVLGGLVRLELADRGEVDGQRLVELAEVEPRGHGLQLVSAIADRWGHELAEDGRQTLWVELKC